MFKCNSVSKAAARRKENQAETSLEVYLTGNNLKAVDHRKSGTARP